MAKATATYVSRLVRIREALDAKIETLQDDISDMPETSREHKRIEANIDLLAELRDGIEALEMEFGQ